MFFLFNWPNCYVMEQNEFRNCLIATVPNASTMSTGKKEENDYSVIIHQDDSNSKKICSQRERIA